MESIIIDHVGILVSDYEKTKASLQCGAGSARHHDVDEEFPNVGGWGKGKEAGAGGFRSNPARKIARACTCV